MGFYTFSLIAFTIGTIIGAIIMYQISRDKIGILLNDEKSSDHYKKAGLLFKYIRLVEVLKESRGGYLKASERDSKKDNVNSNNNLQSENNELRNELEELRMKNDSLIANQNVLTNDFSESNRQENHGIIVKDAPVNSQSNFLNKTYFSIPQSNGSFDIHNGKDRKGEDTFYLIENEENNDRGYLQYIPGELDIRAIDGIDSYLLPVCEIENITNRENASRIELTYPGEVIKEGTNWIINTERKVKIKFI